MFIIKNSLQQSHEIIKKVVLPGDTVVDATMGNGNDTLMLSDLVGPSGMVYSFDIQDAAIAKTKQKLIFNNLHEHVTLIKDGHQNMDLYINQPVKAVMFNLGYLPGGNHSVGTKGETTIIAIQKSMELISLNGIVSIVVYYGGDSGFEEKEMVMDYIKNIDSKHFTVMKTEFVNQPNCPPILICIEKTSL